MRAGNIAVVNALCEHGAYVNDPIQPTAVARPGAPAMRTYGAPQAAHMVDAVDVNGDTALHGAAHRGANVIVAFLVEKGARLDVVDVICWTDPSTKKFISLRVPYPLSFFTRSGTGRIDNPNTGWKGKGFWASYATYASWHIEGGKGSLPKAVKFQMRPSPLAK
jgi:hypothetical protein